MRILIAEDDQVLADGLLRSLRAAGYAVDQVGNGSEADAAVAAHEFDLVILDLGLPRMHGFEVLRKLRARGSSVPVLILTAADSVEQRVKGLDLGADDYMAKPFSLQELEARVRALTRRGLGTASSVLKHGPLTFDATGRVAYLHDQMVELSARELSLLRSSELLNRNLLLLLLLRRSRRRRGDCGATSGSTTLATCWSGSRLARRRTPLHAKAAFRALQRRCRLQLRRSEIVRTSWIRTWDGCRHFDIISDWLPNARG